MGHKRIIKIACRLTTAALTVAGILVLAHFYFGSSSMAFDWKEIVPGFSYADAGSEGQGLTDSFHLQLFLIDLTSFRVSASDARLYGNGMKKAIVREMARRSGAALVVNGSFFDEFDRPLGLVISDAKTLNPFRRADWGVLYVSEGKAGLMHTREWSEHKPEKVDFAIQVGPRIVVGGKPTALKNQVARRALIGVMKGGKKLLVAITDKGWAESNELARFIASIGCSDAVLMDGGPSAQLYAEVGNFKLDAPGGWAVPIGVAFLREK